MIKGKLCEYFSGFGFKRLSATEVDPETSHGHEFQGIGAFRELFGTERHEFSATFIHLSDIHDDGLISQQGDLSWYDSRENQPHRSPEYRLYYHAEVTLVQEYINPEDLIIVAREPDGNIVVMMAEAGSTYEQQLMWLFDIVEEELFTKFIVRDVDDDETLNYASRIILENLGIEIIEEAENWLDVMLDRFGKAFPKTRVFSAFAQETLPEVSPIDNPDTALVQWMDQEELLFRTFERHLVTERLREGFGTHGDDVDAFISFSLSVQNRRKSRVGHALENHLEQVFISHNLSYSRNKETENRAKPDFIFPDIDKYHYPEFPDCRLSMLGVKSSCKDRWRQVLSEAARINEKHLLTMEPGISENQTSEMQSNSLQLVVPSLLHSTYKPEQQTWLFDVADFLDMVRERQSTD
ncbi:MAG: type II restriction endonuclease [Deltaproteobacteria bacterium]|nr:type II restriction endonuclease [Deltaproteobacteria bacterium]